MPTFTSTDGYSPILMALRLLFYLFQVKEYLANPEAFAVAAPVAEAAPAEDAPAAEEKKEEEEDEDEDMVCIDFIGHPAVKLKLFSIGFRSLRLSASTLYRLDMCNALYCHTIRTLTRVYHVRTDHQLCCSMICA
jgi:hypothetical protein